ncbi:MAG: flagellar type III secretion system pore protein FliP [Candidatus Zixiibacteriota bacterium]|nr:MAG: flagellar type III secretion system pore protein FliP [candidate division Zixibacteria bacterium]
MKLSAIIISVFVILMLLASAGVQAQTLPKLTLQVDKGSDSKGLSTTLQIVLLLTVLALAPSILVMMTSFIRIIIVLSFVRQALGTNQLPPSQLIMGVALVMTIFVMSPIISRVHDKAWMPYMNGEITQKQLYEEGIKPLRAFMLQQTREKDLALFVKYAGLQKPQTQDDIPTHVVVPGFILSELRTSFQISLIIFIPFLVIDMVVASVLMSMGMMMLPPVLVALPFKILLFVMVDGWYLIVKSLLESFHVAGG